MASKSSAPSGLFSERDRAKRCFSVSSGTSSNFKKAGAPTQHALRAQRTEVQPLDAAGPP